jgi:hypothetical protein
VRDRDRITDRRNDRQQRTNRQHDHLTMRCVQSSDHQTNNDRSSRQTNDPDIKMPRREATSRRAGVGREMVVPAWWLYFTEWTLKSNAAVVAGFEESEALGNGERHQNTTTLDAHSHLRTERDRRSRCVEA